MRPTVVFLYGPPAVGKLTVDLLTSVFDFGSEPFVRLREEIRIRVATEAVASGSGLIFRFAPERTVTPGFPSALADCVETAGGAVRFIELSCTRERLLQRIEEPDRAKYGKLASLDQFAQLEDLGVFEYDGSLEPELVIDTGEQLPAEAARTIAATLGWSDGG